jgi:hypothetical protein
MPQTASEHEHKRGSAHNTPAGAARCGKTAQTLKQQAEAKEADGKRIQEN